MERTYHVMLAILVVCFSQQTTWADPKPIHFTIVMHIEGYGPSERTDESKFNHHKDAMNNFIVPFEDRGGKLSVELNADFVGAMQNFEGSLSTNTALDLINRGHSVNVHADLAGTVGEETEDTFRSKLSAQKSALEALTDSPVMGVSGICSDLDWVQVAKSVGFTYTTSIVDYCLKSLMSFHVSHDYSHTKDCTTAIECHTPFPYTAPPNITPWRTRAGASWIFDRNHGFNLLTVFPPYHLGGAIECLREGQSGEICTEESADIQIFKTRIKEALRARKDDAQHYLYFVVSIGRNYGSPFVESLAEAVDEFVTDGDLVWKNMDEFYQHYTTTLSTMDQGRH